MLSCCKCKQNREEIDQWVKNCIKCLVSKTCTVHYSKIGKQSDQTGCNTTCCKDWNIWCINVRHHFGKSVQQPCLLFRFISCILLCLFCYVLQFRCLHKLRVNIIYLWSDQNLIITGTYKRSKYPLGFFQCFLIKLCSVFQCKTKSCCTVDAVFNVFCPTNSGDHWLD